VDKMFVENIFRMFIYSFYICRMKIEIKEPTYRQAKAGRKLLYPFNLINVGECLTLEAEDNRISVINAAYQYGTRSGKRFRSEKDAQGVTRIFRIK